MANASRGGSATDGSGCWNDCHAHPDIPAAVWLQRGPLVSYAWQLLGDRDAAEDAVQDVFLRVWSSGAISMASYSYLRTAVRNRAIDELRRSACERSAILRADRDDLVVAPSLLPSSRLPPMLDRVLAMLPERQRTICRLLFIERIPHRAVAEQLGVSENTVKTQARRGRQRLRRILAEAGPIAADRQASPENG